MYSRGTGESGNVYWFHLVVETLYKKHYTYTQIEALALPKIKLKMFLRE